MNRLLWPLILCLGCSLIPGCGSGTSSRYGASTYPERNSSINGLGVFMRLCKDAGIRTIEVGRLSPRLDNVDVLLLVGDTLTPPAKEARDWIETWLGQKPGRSVIYFGRDFDSDVYYRRSTLAQLPPDQQPQARLELAQAQAAEDIRIGEEVPDDTFCRWFFIRTKRPLREINQFAGPWADELDASTSAWPVRVELDPPASDLMAEKPQWSAARSQSSKPGQTTPPGTASSSADDATAPSEPNDSGTLSEPGRAPQTVRSFWTADDIGDDQTWQKEWDKAPRAKILLAGRDGTPLVTSLQSENYKNSQILTVVNGAPLLNGSMVEPLFRQVAHQLIDRVLPARRLAILHFDSSGILMSDVISENQVEGLAILTTWPLNIIFAHLVFGGCLVLLAVFPIFGRPQESPHASVSDFGQHAEAVGQMLAKSGDTHFALQMINDYYTQVCDESPPSWVQSALRTPGQVGFFPARPAVEPSDPPTVSGPLA